MNRRVPFRAALLGASFLLGGCLGEPPLEERWTRLEILETSELTGLAPGTAAPVTVRARITYRELLTGAVIAELRAGNAITHADTGFERGEGDPLATAQDVDFVLRNSTSLGFDARPVTGFDHLIQEMELTFDSGFVPPSPDDLPPAQPAGGSPIFLVLYFGDVDEVEIDGGMEIEVVTPTFSDEADILSVGIEIAP